MIKNSVGELKLSPIKDEGQFVFFNDFITINGKVSKGDRISLFVSHYELKDGKYYINDSTHTYAVLVVRGQKYIHDPLDGFQTVTDLYNRAAELYKEQFYFGSKV